MKPWIKWAFVIGFGLFCVEYVLAARVFSQPVGVGAVILAVVGFGSVLAAALTP